MSRQRLDVKEAAEALGISSEGVRKRIKRGTLESEKDPDGKVYVWLDDGRTLSDPPSGSIDTEALVNSLEDQIDYLRRQLEVWQEEARRKDHIIAALTERIPELEAPSEPRESPVTASESPGGGDVPPDGERRRTWWRRIFGH